MGGFPMYYGFAAPSGLAGIGGLGYLSAGRGRANLVSDELMQRLKKGEINKYEYQSKLRKYESRPSCYSCILEKLNIDFDGYIQSIKDEIKGH